ncbi:chromosome condensation complex protein [Dorcoceras hygrometricum]|uniref:Chromosome condensation complex protein n=1 Tax=Dorcoceras hygrometricum TaxID=472368 RepID=A0A2Z7DJT0_9LAMI|nr:chromosome condensation complex protein [Dorcoceras hygrometricum]
MLVELFPVLSCSSWRMLVELFPVLSCSDLDRAQVNEVEMGDDEQSMGERIDADEAMSLEDTIDVGTSVGDQQLETFDAADGRTDAVADYFVEEPLEGAAQVNEVEMGDDEQSMGERIDADEAMSLEDIFLKIPVDCPIPSADTSAMHFNETDTVVTSPFQPAVTTELSASLDDLRTFLSERLDTQTQDIRQIDDSQNNVLSKTHTLEQGLRDTLRQLEEAFRNLIHSARQDGRTLIDVQTLRLNEFKKGVLAHGASVTADLMDVHKEVQNLNAKVDTVAKGLDDVRKDVEATQEAISHQILDFHAQAQENHNILTDQLGQLVDYINRGGNDKKGEDSSRGPQPPPNDQDRPGGSSGNRAVCLWKFGLQCPMSPLLPPRKVPLEDLIYTSCTDPIPQPAATRTPRLHQPLAVTHLFYAYVRKAIDREFNVVVLGRDLILYWV